MMFIPLLSVLLLSLRGALADGVAEKSPTFISTDQSTGKQVVCDRCPPGAYLRSRCTVTQKSVCAPCPAGSFTELWNYIGKCLRCGVCGQNQVVKKACSADSDIQCECKQGHYSKYDMCFRHTECPSGEGVQTQGTPNADTVCQVCPNGTYSNTVSDQQSCMQHRNCEDAGLQLMLKGCNWHDNVCTNYEELRSKDGAEYFREILPDFFVHQNIAIKRLRQIVHNLPSENRRKREGGAVSGLDISDLHSQIKTWIASATAKQLRDLPAVLTKTGANSAGDKLRNKLRRIDCHLKRLLVSENEVAGLDVNVG